MSLQEVSHPPNNLHRVTFPEGRNDSQAVALCCRDHRLISACRPVHKSRTSPSLEWRRIVHAPADCLHRNKGFLVIARKLGQMLLAKLRRMLAPHRSVDLDRLWGDVRTL